MVLVLVDNQTLLTTKQSDNNSNSNAAVKEFFEFWKISRKKCYQYETNEKVCGESVE